MLAANRGWESQRIYEAAITLRRGWLASDDKSLGPTLARDEFQKNTAKRGFSRLDAEGPAILVPGGPGFFADSCGEHGCLAVRYGRDGKMEQSWPWKPEALIGAPSLRSGDYDYAGSDRSDDLFVTSIAQFPDGDLLLTFNLANAFPYGFGLARLRANGTPAWRLADYYHHRPKIGSDGFVYSPYYEVRDQALYREADPNLRPFVSCRAPERQYADLVHILDGEGRLVREIDLIELFLKDKRHGSSLARVTDPCDPLHLNSVDVAQETIAGTLVAKGDLLLSLRGPSLVVLIAADGSRIKRIYAGSFAVQHSAKFAADGEFVLFDNMGSGPGEYPSRILAVDLATGAERTVRARRNPADLVEYATTVGDIALSSDRRRALIAYTQSGTLLEIDLASGRELSRYTHRHSLAGRGSDNSIYKLYASNYSAD